jgi:predicted transcriptional regulator
LYAVAKTYFLSILSPEKRGWEYVMIVMPVFVSASDIKPMRKALGLTQQKFADSYGFSIDAVKSWETGRRQLGASSYLKLKLMSAYPKDLQKLLLASDNTNFWNEVETMSSSLSNALEMMCNVAQGKETIPALIKWLQIHHPNLLKD